jgi:hypothetical protein
MSDTDGKDRVVHTLILRVSHRPADPARKQFGREFSVTTSGTYPAPVSPGHDLFRLSCTNALNSLLAKAEEEFQARGGPPAVPAADRPRCKVLRPEEEAHWSATLDLLDRLVAAADAAGNVDPVAVRGLVVRHRKYRDAARGARGQTGCCGPKG